MPLILVKQAEGRQDVSQAFDRWAARDPLFQIRWEFTRLGLRQITDQDWSEEDRDRWRRLCGEADRIAIEPERALANLRRFLRQPA